MSESYEELSKADVDELKKGLDTAFNEAQSLLGIHSLENEERMRVLRDISDVRLALHSVFTHDPTIAKVRAAIVDLALPQSSLECLSQAVESVGFSNCVPSYDDIQGELHSRTINLANREEVECRMNGALFLKSALLNNPTAANPLSLEEQQKICDLQKQVVEVFGKPYGPCVHLLYLMLNGDFVILEQIVTSQCSAHQHNAQQDESHFFQHMLRFLGFYSDITAYVVDQAEAYRDDATAERAKQVSLDTIPFLLRDPHLRMFQPVTDNTETNLFSFLRTKFSAQKGANNPWLLDSLQGTPYDATKIADLIYRGIPREALAHVLAELNNYHVNVRTRELLAMKAIKDDVDNGSAEYGKGIIHRLTLLAREFGRHPSKQDDPGQVIEQLQEHVPTDFYDPLKPIRMSQGRPVHPEDVMVRVIDPASIVENEGAQSDFMIQYRRIMGSHRQEDLRRNILLGHSLQTVLQGTDPHLDIQIPAFKYKSIRDLLTDMTTSLFEQQHIRHGFDTDPLGHYCQSTGRILPSLDADMLDCTTEELRKDFNTAGVGIERGMLLNAGRALVRMKGHDRAMRFTKHQVKSYLRAQSYQVQLFSAATHGFSSCIEQFCKSLKSDDTVIISDQEYDTLTELLKERGIDVNPLYMNGKKHTKPKTLLELQNEYVQRIRQKKAKMILLSSRTRFGDSPCSAGGGDSSGNLQKLIAHIKKECPETIVVVDGCQAIGRMKHENLTKMDPDIYLGSGFKALGVGPAAFVAVSDRLVKKEGDFKDQASTLPSANLAAMGIGLRMLSSHTDNTRLDGNFGKARSQCLEIKVARQMSRLTQYAIKKADEYGPDLLSKCSIDPTSVSPASLVDKHQLEMLMGCRVLRPVHRNARDYTGILTLHFPDKLMKGSEVHRKLEKKGFKVISCLRDRRAFRISFHYLHEERDIDALFAELQSIHLETVVERNEAGHKFNFRLDIDKD